MNSSGGVNKTGVKVGGLIVVRIIDVFIGSEVKVDSNVGTKAVSVGNMGELVSVMAAVDVGLSVGVAGYRYTVFA